MMVRGSRFYLTEYERKMLRNVLHLAAIGKELQSDEREFSIKLARSVVA